ncbi:class I SAM-dependent methyltransferase [Streptomyces sp. NPDC002643]
MHTIANRQQAKAWNDWEGILWAERPERYNGMMGAFNAPLFAAAGIKAQDRVLDVGCGTGQTTRLAAQRAYDGNVVGIDLSGPMLERARRDAATEGLDNVTFEQGDAQVHPFPDRGFDVLISRGGVMFFADHVAAFTHLRHALVPAGRLAFLGPQPAGPDSAYARATAALSPFLREASPASRGMGSLLDPARIRQVLAAGGFTDIEVAPFEAPMTFGAGRRRRLPLLHGPDAPQPAGCRPTNRHPYPYRSPRRPHRVRDCRRCPYPRVGLDRHSGP